MQKKVEAFLQERYGKIILANEDIEDFGIGIMMAYQSNYKKTLKESDFLHKLQEVAMLCENDIEYELFDKVNVLMTNHKFLQIMDMGDISKDASLVAQSKESLFIYSFGKRLLDMIESCSEQQSIIIEKTLMVYIGIAIEDIFSGYYIPL